jgi:hypothetical protein
MKRHVAFLLSLLLGAGSALAQDGRTINQLSPGAALVGTEQIPMYQGSNPAVTSTPQAIATYVPTRFNSIDAAAQPGADPCAQISAAATALSKVQSAGGTIDARGFVGTQPICAGSMFPANWPSYTTGNYVVLFGAATFIQNVPFIVPPQTHLIGLQSYGSGGPSTVFQIGSSYLVSVPGPTTLTPGTGGSIKTSTTIYVKLAYANSVGESTPNAETSATVDGTTNHQLTVTAPGAATGATVYYVYAATSPGSEVLQNPGGTPVSTNYVFTSAPSTSSNVVPALAMPVIQLTPRNGLNPPGNYYGAQVSYIAADCVKPSTSTYQPTITAFYNDNAQQGSWFEHMTSLGCATMLDLESSAFQNSGPYIDLQQGGGGLSLPAESVCAFIGSHAPAGGVATIIQKLTCGSNSSTPQAVSIYLDAGTVSLRDLDLELAVIGIEVGQYHGVAGSSVQNVNCGGSVTKTCIDIASGIAPDNFLVLGMQNVSAPNAINDHSTNGQDITAKGLSIYARGYNNQVFSDAKGFGGPLNLSGVSGSNGTAAKYVCVDSNGNVLLSSNNC